MDSITVTYNTILQLFGAIAIVGGGVKILFNLFSPWREMKKEVEKIKCFLKNDKDKLDATESRITAIDEQMGRIEDALAVLGLAVSEMINHEITGNDVGELKKQQKKLNEFFYKGKE